MRERGVVRSVSGGRAVIRMEEGALCARCGLCRAVGGKGREIEVAAPDCLSPGDAVDVLVEPGVRLRASAVVFLLPMVIFLAALIVSERSLGKYPSRDMISFFIATGAAFAAFAAVALYDRRLRRRGVDLVRVEKVGAKGFGA